MEPPATEQWDDAERHTVELPATATGQRALHEAMGHLYDQLAVADEADGTDAIPDEVFDRLEELYVATAEDSVSTIELAYELEE